MVVVAGRLHVAAEGRAAYLETCAPVVEQARVAHRGASTSSSALTSWTRRASTLASGWESQEDVERFRGAGVEGDQAARIEAADVAEHDVIAERSLTG